MTRLKYQKPWSSRKRQTYDQLICDAPGRTGDPTGTLDLRRRYGSLVEGKWRKVSSVLVTALGPDRDFMGLNPARATSLPSGDRLQSLQKWLSDLTSRLVVEASGEWLRPMIQQSYGRSLVRAMRLTKTNAIPSDQTGTINSLWAMCVAELQGICEAVTQQVVRAAGFAQLHNESPRDLARMVKDRVSRIGVTRSTAMIDLMIVKAFSTGTLDQFQAAGIQRVGLIAETIPAARARHDSIHDAPAGPGSRINRSTGETSARTLRRIRAVQRKLEALGSVNVETAGDEDVCPICEGIEEDNPYTINEARSLIPAHPRCRCAFVPVEDDDLEDENLYREPEGGQFAKPPARPHQLPGQEDET